MLVECTCDYYGDEAEPHWSWAYWYFDEGFMSLSGHETLAEPEPVPGDNA